jgi:hypothetical protein
LAQVEPVQVTASGQLARTATPVFLPQLPQVTVAVVEPVVLLSPLTVPQAVLLMVQPEVVVTTVTAVLVTVTVKKRKTNCTNEI